MFSRISFFILALLAPFLLSAQQKFTISGYVKDASNGESLIGAGVKISPPVKGVSTNQYGFYSLTTDAGEYDLVISYLGFNDYKQHIKLDQDMRINVSLNAKSIETDAVVIESEKTDKNVSSGEMSQVKMDIEQIKSIPAFLGEVDVLKTIQLIPGVKSSGDGNSGFYVRGGGPDQNLILLDEATVYNASHLFGFFSVFNGDAVKSVNLIKGGMPAQYGGRLSSVLDISMKEGNDKEWDVDGGIGVIASRLTVQGPIKKDTASFILSARRTYIDVLMAPFIKDDSPFKGSGYFFYDLNTKLNWRLSDKDRLFVSGYFGRDVFSFKDNNSDFKVDIPWGNATTSARWNHLFNDKLFVNTSAIFSDYNFSFGGGQDGFEFKLKSGIRDFNVKSDFSWYPDARNQVRFGANYVYHIFTPNNASAKSGDVVFDLGGEVKQYAHEAALYFGDDFDLTEKLHINAGVRWSYFMQVGEFNRFIHDVTGRVTDTIHYNKGQKVADYNGFEPRFSLRYMLDSKSSIKASFVRNYQYVHLATLSGATLPTDIWVPCSDRVKPQIGWQAAAGYFRNFKDNTYETSVEVYYKHLRNQVEFAEGALPDDGVKDNADNSFVFGEGWSYGSEFFLKKRTGKFNGWVGYTLSWTERKFEDLNYGNVFPAKYDRRHDVSVVAIYDISKRWTLSAVWVYGTGSAITIPVARYFIDGNIVNEYGDRNSYRMAPYHRLDFSATLQGKKHKHWETNWNFSVYNVYNRKNPYFIFFDNEGSLAEGTLQVTAKQVSLFPVLPSITWNFKF